MQKKLTIHTSKKRELVDLTDRIANELMEAKNQVVTVHLFLSHTTAALTTADLDPGTDKDFLEMLDTMTPSAAFRHPHDPDHAPDHIWASLIGPELTVPVREGVLLLGTWQRIVLVEFDGPRQRTVWVRTEVE